MYHFEFFAIASFYQLRAIKRTNARFSLRVVAHFSVNLKSLNRSTNPISSKEDKKISPSIEKKRSLTFLKFSKQSAPTSQPLYFGNTNPFQITTAEADILPRKHKVTTNSRTAVYPTLEGHLEFGTWVGCVCKCESERGERGGCCLTAQRRLLLLLAAASL